MKNFLQFLRRAWRYFRGTRRVWRRPPQSDLLIIDRGTASPLDEMFAHHNPHIMDIRGESINMLALLRALPKARLGAVAYLEAYIDFVKPKLVLSRTDNNHTLWQLKRRPDVTYQVALVQNGWRTKFSRSVSPEFFQTTGQIKTVDNYFVVGGSVKRLLSPVVRARFEEVGSLTLNNILAQEITSAGLTRSNQKSVALISTFRSKEILLNDSQKCVYKSLDDFLFERDLSLLIIGNGVSESEIKLEKTFFDHIFTKTKMQLGSFRLGNRSYSQLQNHRWILSGHSTLGYEALIFGIPVGFVLPDSPEFDGRDFQASSGLGEFGAFWCRSNQPAEHRRVFSYLETVSDEQWERDSGWIRDQLMVHDYGNTKIRAYVEGVLTDSLENK